MKKRFYTVIIACLLVTPQAKPFLDPGSLAVATGGFVFSYIRNSLMSAAVVALHKKALNAQQIAKEINDKILALHQKLGDPALAGKKGPIIAEIDNLIIKRDKEITLADRLAGYLSPAIGTLGSALSTYGAVSAFTEIFGYGLPSPTSILYSGASWLVGSGTTP